MWIWSLTLAFAVINAPFVALLVIHSCLMIQGKE